MPSWVALKKPGREQIKSQCVYKRDHNTQTEEHAEHRHRNKLIKASSLEAQSRRILPQGSKILRGTRNSSLQLPRTSSIYLSWCTVYSQELRTTWLAPP